MRRPNLLSQRLRVFVTLCAFLLCWTANAAESDRPNILYIALEDITPMMGCYGDAYAKTPNIDKLASEGVRFDNAITQNPICTPSRMCFIFHTLPVSEVAETTR